MLTQRLAVGFGLGFGLAMVLLLAGCSSREVVQPSPSPNATRSTATETLTPTIEPSATATPPQGHTYPSPKADGAFVYVVSLGFDMTPGRLYPRKQVISQDLRSGRIKSRIEFGGSGEYPVGAALAGRRVVLATETKLTRFALDGSGERTLFSARESAPIQDLAVSPDGKIAAVAMGCSGGSPVCPSGPAVAFVDVDSGATVAMADYAALRVGGFKGYAWQLIWRADGAGVVLKGGTGSEAVGGRALVKLDGAVTVYQQPPGYGSVSPDGRFAAENTDQLGCMRVGGHAMQVVNLETGAIVRHVGGGAGAYAAWEWSPDGRSVLYQFLPSADLTGCEWADATPEHWLLDLVTGVSTAVPDVPALHAAWYGSHFVELVWADGTPNQPARSRSGDLDAVFRVARAGDADGDLFVGGVKIASWPPSLDPPRAERPQPVGFLD